MFQDQISAANTDLIKDVTAATFMQDVIEASMQQPVLVDFWAPWCGPCKQLTPILERAVQQAGGKVRLAKINIDDNQEIAAQMRIQSVPMVYAFVQGRPVDVMQGVMPESEINAFIQKIIRAMPDSQADQLEAILAQASEALTQHNYAGAMQIYAAILQQDPSNPKAIAGLVKCYIGTEDFDQAQATLAMVPEEHLNDPDIVAVRATIELIEKTKDLGSPKELVAKIEANEEDWQAHFDLAMIMNAHGERKKAIDHLMVIIRKDRDWNEDAARKQLLTFFEAWGAADPMTLSGRRALSSALFS